jgi:hypothetical protein
MGIYESRADSVIKIRTISIYYRVLLRSVSNYLFLAANPYYNCAPNFIVFKKEVPFMHRFRSHWILGTCAILAAAFLASSCGLFTVDSSDIQYETLSPWADVDPRPLTGISPRLDNLSGKKIGLFANYKRAAMPIARSLQDKFQKKYPDSEFSIYHSDQWNVNEIDTENGEKFKKWVEDQDAVILMVGD